MHDGGTQRRASDGVLYLVVSGAPAPEGWRSDPASLEDLVLGYLRDPGVRMLPGPAMAASAGGPEVTP